MDEIDSVIAGLGIGDPVEVKFISRATGEIWRPATVTKVEHHCIYVAFALGDRMAVQNRRGLWRRARLQERSDG